MKQITWINLLLGIWLIIAPFAMGYSAVAHTATGNEIVLGILLIAFSWWILAAMAPPVGASWFQILCGIWLIISPWVLAYSRVTHAAGNDVVAGIIAIVIGLIESRAIVTTPPRVA